MIASTQHGFVFIKTRKTAGTSVEIALSRYVGAPGDVVTAISPADEEVRRQTTGAHGPTGTRLPLRRRLRGAPREWRNHVPAAVVARHLPSWGSSRRWAVMRSPWDVAASTLRWRRRVTGDPGLDFDGLLATGWHPRTNWDAITIDGEPVVDVIRFDRLVADLTDRLAGVGIAFDGHLPRTKVTGGDPGASTLELLAPRHVELVAELCAPEIERFGWLPP